MNKKRIIVVSILIILIAILALWINRIIPKQIARISATNELEEGFSNELFVNATINGNNSKITEITISKALIEPSEPEKEYTLNHEEIKTMVSIIDNLSFSKETCDGYSTYNINFNSEEKESCISYGLETYFDEYHILSYKGEGEAIVSGKQKEELEKIIKKINN